jgi:hypothetical protein
MAEKQQKPKINKRISNGISGEHLALWKLTSMGYIAALTLKNTKNIDILVTNENASKMACIQVKTIQERKNSWVLSKKDEKLISKNLYYVFIRLNTNKPNDFYVAKSVDVAEFIIKHYEDFIARGRIPNTMRTFIPKAKDKDNWDILGL